MSFGIEVTKLSSLQKKKKNQKKKKGRAYISKLPQIRKISFSCNNKKIALLL